MGAKRATMRCRACGRQVTRRLNVCPFCGRNPAFFHTRWRPTILSVLVGVLAGIGLFPLAPMPSWLLARPEPTVTVRAAAVVRPTFTPTPTQTPLPSATPTETALPTLTPTATSTPRVAPTAGGTNTATPTPRPTVAPPRLVGPKDGTDYGSGEEAEIILQWEGGLQEGQQFAVTVRYVNRSDATETRGTWTRDTRWRVDLRIFRDIALGLRALKWDVTVIDGAGNALSAPSESRIFYWH